METALLIIIPSEYIHGEYGLMATSEGEEELTTDMQTKEAEENA